VSPESEQVIRRPDESINFRKYGASAAELRLERCGAFGQQGEHRRDEEERKRGRRGEAAHDGERERLIGLRARFEPERRRNQADDGGTLVIMMGVKRVRAAATTASSREAPSLNRVLASATSKIPFDTAIPITMSTPIRAVTQNPALPTATRS
jgi:hypothetical protein